MFKMKTNVIKTCLTDLDTYTAIHRSVGITRVRLVEMMELIHNSMETKMMNRQQVFSPSILGLVPWKDTARQLMTCGSIYTLKQL